MTNLINGLGGVAGFGENTLTRNDDSYTSNVSITPVFGSGGLNFFGTNYTVISINNNGNITFGSSGMSTYTPFGLQSGRVPIIAPYFADVDTRGSNSSAPLGPNVVTPTAGGTSKGSNLVYYDFNNTGYGTLTVTWDDVGYYNSKTDKLNAFQLQLVGTGSGNFDVIFRYEAVNWTTGSASGGTNGFGGTVARAGYATGDGTSWYELPQSGIQDQMLALETSAGNTGVAGYYKFRVFSGTSAPETMNGTPYDDILAGVGGNDILNGFAGNDSLDGNQGADRMVGGIGNDNYVVDDTGDQVVELLNQGSDTVQTGLDYTLGANVENLILTGSADINGTGNALNNVLTGNSGDNVLNGLDGSDTASYASYNSGITLNLSLATQQYLNGYDTLLNIENAIGTIRNDTLQGSVAANFLDGNLGEDRLTGGQGNDTYVVDVAPNPASSVTGDVITELAGEGIDTVNSSVSWTLGSNLENLRLTGAGVINGVGNDLNNTLFANIANNTLNGGAGNDTISYLYGSTSAGVKVNLGITAAQATGGSGTDVILNFENLTGSNYNDSLTGNAIGNTLNGGGGNDILNGAAGADIMNGGNGSDTYYVDNAGDVVNETNRIASTGGVDTVYSYRAAYTLGANVENGRILGTVAANMTGNGLNNVLYPGSGINAIDGDIGTDTVSYQFATTAGTKGVNLNLSLVNGAGQSTAGGISSADLIKNVENITGSNYIDNLTGNSGNNTLAGGAGNDSINGGGGNDILIGGAGKDALIGGVGNDTFDFNALGELGLLATRDTITSFVRGQDKIDLSTIDAKPDVAGDQAFTFATTAFSGVGQVSYAGDIVSINTDTDTTAEYQIQLIGAVPASLAATDFIL